MKKLNDLFTVTLAIIYTVSVIVDQTNSML